jgi:GTP-binding protein EngB required for normal cell division
MGLPSASSAGGALVLRGLHSVVVTCYTTTTDTCVQVLILVDARRGVMQADHSVMAILSDADVPFQARTA